MHDLNLGKLANHRLTGDAASAASHIDMVSMHVWSNVVETYMATIASAAKLKVTAVQCS